MSDDTDDLALLRRYAESECEEAFATLVARHIHYVYSVARRECASAHQAEEVTQAAFIILARKAGRLPSNTILSGWLFRTVRYVASNARRAEQRRRLYEEEVAHMSAHESPEETVWEQVAPLLNDGLAALSHADRDAITLRFFEKRSHAEIAAAQRTNEAAARKRLSRALDRLRTFLARRGVVIPAAALTAALTTHAVEAAPLTLISGVTSAVVKAGSSTSALVTTTLQLMAWSKLKIAGAAAIVVLLAGGAAVMVNSPGSKDGPLSRTLPDGSTFTLTQMEMASRVNFRYPEPKEGVKQSSSSMSLVSVDGLENFFVGTTHEGGTGNIEIGRVQVESDEGSVFDGIFSGGTLAVTEGRFQAWRLYSFPRRGSHLTLRFFYPDRDGRWVSAAAMNVPNPAPGPHGQWVPHALPIAQTNGDLVVTLVEFEAGGAQRQQKEKVSRLWKRLPGTHCAFTLHQAGKEVAPWAALSLQVSDATGNQWKQNDFVSWPGDETEPRLHTSMVGALWASEPAWDLRVELSRTNDFQPEELLTLSNIPVPQPEESLALQDTHFVNGLDLEVAAIAGAKAELTQPHQRFRNEGKMNLALTMHGERGHKRISLVSVQDDQGRPVPFEGRPSTYERREWVFGFQSRPDARSLSFTLAVHESRFVEFRAKPKQIELLAGER
jgi:RNA polymerase sigma factor (sigma-70 family)